jgi:hypothetical protein
LDIEKLVELATKAIIERLNNVMPKVAVYGDIPEGFVTGAEIKTANSCADAEGSDYVVMSTAKFCEMMGIKCESAATTTTTAVVNHEGTVIDFLGKRLLHERDLRDMNVQRGDIVKVSNSTIITALAHDYAKGIGAKIQKEVP